MHKLSAVHPGANTAIDRCYSRAVQWISNLSKVPYGTQGKSSVRELTRLFYFYAENSALECIRSQGRISAPSF